MIRSPFVSAVSALALLCASAPANAGVQYAYDSAGRLIRVQYSNGVTINYSYDAAGNRREITTSRIPNRSPVAHSDTASVNSFAFIDIQVRDNDSDADRDALTITGVSAVSGGGTAQIMGNGAYIRYTAPAGGGVKTFTYTISDGRGGSATATVTIHVNHVNRPPVANVDSTSLMANAGAAVMVLANDSDPDGDALTVTGVSAPNGGSAAVAPGGGYVTYQAPATPGAYSFTYWISDGAGGTASAPVNVTVSAPPNAAPVANDDHVTTLTSTSIDIFVRNNDTDPNGDALTVTSVSGVSGGGTATVVGGAHIRFDAPGNAGAKTFTYTISDGRGGTSSATVTVIVTAPANRPPVAVNDHVGLYAGSTEAIMVLANDSDPDGHPLTIIAVGGATGANAEIAPGGGYIYYSTPLMPANRTFTYTISDGHGGTATATVTVTIMPDPNVCDPYSTEMCVVDP